MAGSGRIPRRKLDNQGLEVSAIGLGCAALSGQYSRDDSIPDDNAVNLIHHAFKKGVILFDTSEAYGPYTNEVLLGKMGELKKLVEEGKVKYVGLTEARADTIRRAHAIHPLSAVQLE